jgi:tRNA (guanine-N7-)-methyltransferase
MEKHLFYCPIDGGRMSSQISKTRIKKRHPLLEDTLNIRKPKYFFVIVSAQSEEAPTDPLFLEFSHSFIPQILIPSAIIGLILQMERIADMRLRRNPKAIELLTTHSLSVTDYENQKGNWKKIFDNPNSIYVELGTGKGQFLAKASAIYPDINWIGVEKIQEPLLLAARKGEETRNTNIRYLWLDIVKLQEAFAPGEVDRFYLHFSDPWPKTRHYKRRLTYRDFLEVYQTLLSPNGDLILKTDSESLYRFSVDELQETNWTIIEQSDDLHHSKWDETNITTEYEEKFAGLGMPIYYLKAIPIH